MNSARIGRTVREMRAAGLKQLIVSSSSSVFYYTGKWVHPGERMLALLIRDSGDAVLYANRLFALSSAFSGGLVEYDDTDDCVSVLAQGLGDGVLGIEKTWPSQFTLRLQEARPDIKMRIGSACSPGLLRPSLRSPDLFRRQLRRAPPRQRLHPFPGGRHGDHRRGAHLA